MADGAIRAADLLDEKALLLFEELEDIIQENIKATKELREANIHLSNTTMKNAEEQIIVEQKIEGNRKEMRANRLKEIALEEQYWGVKKKIYTQDAVAQTKADAQRKTEAAAKKASRKKETADLKKMQAFRNKMEVDGNRSWKNAVAFREKQRRKEVADVKRAEKEKQSARLRTIAKLTAAWFVARQVIGVISRAFSELASKIILLDSFAKLMFRITGSTYDAAESLIYLTDIGKRFGVSLEAMTQRYAKFFTAAKQAGLAVDEIRLIFTKVTKVSGILGLKTDELRGVFLALEQMLSKGKVTTEELRRQLGERLPGAFGIMAQAVNKLNPDMEVTVRNMDALLKSGAILSAEVMPEFARQLELVYNAMDVERVETVVAAQERAKNSYLELIAEVNQGGDLNLVVRGWYDLKTAFLENETAANKLTDATEDQINMLHRLDAIRKNARNKGWIGLVSEVEVAAATKQYENYKQLVLDTVDAKRLERLIDIDLNKLIIAKQLDAGLLLTDEERITAEKKIQLLLDSLDLEAKEDLLKVYQDIAKLTSGDSGPVEGSLAFYDKKISDINKELKTKLTINDADREQIALLKKQKEGLVKLREELAKLLGLGKKGKVTPKDKQEPLFGNVANDEQINDLRAMTKVYREMASVAASVGSDMEKQFEDTADSFERMADEMEAMKLGLSNITQLPELRNNVDVQGTLVRGASNAKQDAGGAFKLFGATPEELAAEYEVYVDLLGAAAMDYDDWLNGKAAKTQAIFDNAVELTNQLFDIGNALFERQIENINAEIVATEKKYDRMYELAEGDKEHQKDIARIKAFEIEKLEKKELKIRQKQAKLQKAQAITNAIINTALAVTSMAGGPPFANIALMALVAAVGAASIATIIAQPIPQYKEGRVGGKEEMAILGDGGKHEYILGNHGITRTPRVPTMMHLKKGDSVLKDDKALQQMLSQTLLKEHNIKLHSDRKDMEEALIKAVKKTQVKNYVKMPTVKVDIDHAIWLSKNSQF